MLPLRGKSVSGMYVNFENYLVTRIGYDGKVDPKGAVHVAVNQTELLEALT
jgi:hypothetical protein